MTQTHTMVELREGIALPGRVRLQHGSPEFHLVLACLAWPLRQEMIERVCAASSAVEDWPHVLAIAARHRVVGLVWRAIVQAKITVPADTAAAFQRAAIAGAKHAFLLSIESVRLGRLLNDAGVEALFLKGTTVAQLAYGELSLRHAKDIDVLVPRASVEDAIACLRQGGYTPVFDLNTVAPARHSLWFRYAKSMDWIHTALGVQLELHWRLTDLPLLQKETAALPSQRVRIGPAGELPTLQQDALLAYLCVHGAAHGWMRLKWLADVFALLPHDPDACDETYRRLLDLRAGNAAGLALLLCHDLLGLRLSPALRHTLEADGRLRVLRSLALRLYQRGGEVKEVNDLRFGTTSVYVSRLLVGRGLRALGRELRTWAYTPEELLTTRLPEPLWFAFPLVRALSWTTQRIRHGGRSAPGRG